MPVTKPDHRQQLFGAVMGRSARQAVQHLRNHYILNRREFCQQAMKLEHKTDMAAPQTPAGPLAKPGRRGTIHNDITAGRLFQKAGDIQQG